MSAELVFIGRIETPYPTLTDCPRQPNPEDGPCRIIVDEAYSSALHNVKAGDKAHILYWFDQADRSALSTTPPWSTTKEEIGVFSTRSPNRPNPIALSAVEIISVRGNTITVSAMDCVNGTPLLDIKHYVDQLHK